LGIYLFLDRQSSVIPFLDLFCVLADFSCRWHQSNDSAESCLFLPAIHSVSLVRGSLYSYPSLSAELGLTFQGVLGLTAS
jgi:hypothetical protein